MKNKKTIRLTESALREIIKESIRNVWTNPEEEEREYAENAKILFWLNPENNQITIDGKTDKENDELIPFFIFPILRTYKLGFDITDIDWDFDILYPQEKQKRIELMTRFGNVINKFRDDNYLQIEKLIRNKIPCKTY